MNPLSAATLRLAAAAAVADERDRCDAKATDIRMVLRELARLQELNLDAEPVQAMTDRTRQDLESGEEELVAVKVNDEWVDVTAYSQEVVASPRVHPDVGCSVIYVSPQGVPHAALVTEVWGFREAPDQPAINLCYVSVMPEHRDVWGRRVVYVTSVVHESMQSAGRNCWRWDDEK